MHRRLTSLAALIGVAIFVVFALFQDRTWHSLPQSFGRMGKHIWSSSREGSHDDLEPHAWRAGGGGFKEPKVNAKSPYAIGKTKPAGSNYTKCLVVPELRSEDTSWIDEELGDMLESGLLTKAEYVMDDPLAPLHPVKNKGNEVMAYLSYIIDSYEKLPDVAIFMHSHRYAWHNNIVLDQDAALMVRHLSPERVTREGYMNLRCHWEPGCPDWLHPTTAKKSDEKPEALILAESWAELFPGAPVPLVLAQPCCGQFAVSRERISAIPKERFIQLRDWVLNTELDNELAGRVFEYTWQYIFTASPLHCPSMSACYCDGYGLCFGSPEKFDYYFELLFNLNRYKDILQLLHEKPEAGLPGRERGQGSRLSGDELREMSEVGRDEWLNVKIAKIEAEMKRRAEAAFALGKDPRQRALEAGRPWRVGDGF